MNPRVMPSEARHLLRRSLVASLLGMTRAVALLGMTPLVAPAAEPPGETELPEIVVTSQKVEQTLEETPASVSSISGEFLHDIGATGFDKLADYAGNVTISL